MTLDQSIAMYDEIQERLNRIMDSLQPAISKSLDNLAAMPDALNSAALQIGRLFDNVNTQVSMVLPEAFSAAMQNISKMEAQLYASFPQIMENYLQLSEITYQNLQSVFAGPLVNESAGGELQEFYEPIAKKHRLTFSQTISLLNLLIAFFFGLISLLPDKQLETISEQNEIIINQNEQGLQETKELTEAIETLYDAIQTLSDDLENNGVLSDNSDGIEDLDGK